MRRVFPFRLFLTSAKGWEAVFLTLLFFFVPLSTLYAADDETGTSTEAIASQSAGSAIDDFDKGHRTAMLWKYVRQQAPGWAPGLAETLRAPLGWARSVGALFDGAVGEGSDGDDMPSILRPLSGLMQSPSPDAAQGMWLTPSYHHKGFLPFHDAMMAGMDFRRHVLGGRMQVDFKPFYGQNWVSLNGYGGARFDIALIHGGESQPWGRIGFGYTDGASYLMDDGRGFDLHAELRFDDRLSLHAEMRSQPEGDYGNYVIMRWKLVEFGR